MLIGEPKEVQGPAVAEEQKGLSMGGPIPTKSSEKEVATKRGMNGKR